MTLNGVLYFPDNQVKLTGSGGIQSSGNQLIANSITMSSGTFNLFYSSTTAFKNIVTASQTPYLVK